MGLLGAVLKDLLEMDHIGVTMAGDEVIYHFKTTSVIPSLVEMKAKILSVLDTPVDIPKNVEVREVKRGPLFKEYLVDITVPARKVGELSDLLAKKYGIFRRRPYSGEGGI